MLGVAGFEPATHGLPIYLCNIAVDGFDKPQNVRRSTTELHSQKGEDDRIRTCVSALIVLLNNLL